ncbi:tyrosine-type recombinase/integrase [Streptomyces decoyicus]
MRHTCASWLVQKGVSLYEVQHLLGRERFQTTQRYAHLQRDAHKPSSTPGSAWRLPWPLFRSGEAGFVMAGGDVLAAVTVLRGLDPSAVGEGKA